jgi:RIO-like serine/threonine protein kinase
MPYFGQTLSDINWNLKLIAEKLAKSYQHATKNGIIHGDLKPDNIFVNG